MNRRIVIVLLTCFASIITATPSYTTYLYPEHRNALRPQKFTDQIPINNYEFQVIPSDEYALAEYDSSNELSLLDFIPNPITAIIEIGSKACSAVKWIIINGAQVILGMALVIGFCAFTSYCTLIIEKPLVREIRSLNIPYLDDIEYYLHQAYTKYQDMQSSQ